MASRRALKDVSFLVVLVSCADGIQNKKGYLHLNVTGPFTYVQAHLDFLQKQFPIERDKLKFLHSVQKVVNGFVPSAFSWWTPELKFWFAGQVTMRLIATRWRPPNVEYMINFAQSLYQVGQEFSPTKMPEREIITLLMQSPELLRKKHGMFLPSC